MAESTRYALLESDGRYFDGLSSRPREVILGFRERSLIIRTMRDEVLTHWPLASLRAVSARHDRPVQIVPNLESDERLVVSDETMIEAITTVCPDLYHRPVDHRGMRRAIVWGLGAVGAVLAMVFVLIPALAGQLALMIPPERERALGDALVGQLTQILDLGGSTSRFCIEAEGREALDRMAARLGGGARLPYPLRLDVLDHGMINAVALPGGRILVFRGLIDSAATPEEVAGVLAHEIGHAIHRDPTVVTLRAAGTAGLLGLLIGDIFGASAIAAASDAALNASYQREAEARADEVALQLLAEAGLPSRPFAQFFERLEAQHGSTPLALRYFASHPELAERAGRAAAADTIGDGAFTPALSDRDWIALKGICSTRG
ncbi:M48 family metallopeptidase [Limibaculum sp. M0105]|uniref:M48 family metallopeptidase n=1 Tax=Thermohalobaculum xanthum TaxID=2753746 RepID=A0A8J7SDS9_9RHOB|nr:M48 family metallopeptidase [Thermohalobaculum xanthum]MBK0399418.1 M48 family metallopeptidase [Thermohalobaculum xanthum]